MDVVGTFNLFFDENDMCPITINFAKTAELETKRKVVQSAKKFLDSRKDTIFFP